MNPDRDVTNVRFVGILSFGLGIVLLLLTFGAGLSILFVSTENVSQLYSLKSLSQLILSLATSLTLIGCGSQLQRLKPYSASGVESLRLCWTALFLMMLIAAVAGFWLLPILANLALLILIGLVAIRGAVVRLSN